MAQYQTFPDAAGDSRTFDKLRSLKLPDLMERSFLDVGCNEGFFCGFAKFLGASRSVGVDQSKLFIERARQRFPDCEFHQQSWDELPGGPFDVILLASALHYAQDQPGLVSRLVDCLSRDGVLVLEMGIASSQENAWIEVERGIDQRQFPTMEKLREILRGFAWKWMGRSVMQEGDPVARHVVHVGRRRPVAYLFMQPPGYGKSSIAGRLFASGDVPVVSGDQRISQAVQGKIEVSRKLRSALARDYSPYRIDESVRRIFDAGLGDELVHLWVQPGMEDFALDAYVPLERHKQIEDLLSGMGYLPVQLHWDRIGPSLMPATTIDQKAEAFYRALGAPGVPRPAEGADIGSYARGYVDRVAFEDGQLVISGWAVNHVGELPEKLGVRAKGNVVFVEGFDPEPRPDVQKHIGLAHPLVGYRTAIKLPGVAALQDLTEDFMVFIPEDGQLRLAEKVRKLLWPDA